ncbi:MAG TPA: type II secretion system F family protein [Terriglobales bacterium]|nr:type II secretion system F family protein [Terriglobales bacterium]
MSLLFPLALFLAVALAMFTIGLAVWAPTSGLGARIQWLLGRQAAARPKPDVQERIERVLEPISKAVPKSPEDLSEARLLMMQAGYREPRHLQMYFGIRGLLVIVVLLLGLLSGLLIRAPLVCLPVCVLAWIAPQFVLKRMIKARQRAIQLGLPDALDLAVICVEAGLGIDQSMTRVATELQTAHPALSDELLLMNLELRAGKPRGEAFRNLAGRTGVSDVKSLVAVLVQADRFGTSIAQALRTHADALRVERRQRAEEAAAKTGIKMTPVLVLFILPPIFIVTLGPVIVQMVRNVLPGMGK